MYKKQLDAMGEMPLYPFNETGFTDDDIVKWLRTEPSQNELPYSPRCRYSEEIIISNDEESDEEEIEEGTILRYQSDGQERDIEMTGASHTEADTDTEDDDAMNDVTDIDTDDETDIDTDDEQREEANEERNIGSDAGGKLSTLVKNF